jgi:superfamily II DNA or RNA helicase
MMYCKNDGLRDYQQEMKLRLFEEWELHRSVMVQMPTGTGKTHLLAAVVKEFLCGGGVGMRVWIVAHRRELVEQIEETVARYGMGKEPDKSAKNGRTGKDSMPEESGRVRVFSIQWLSRNRKIMDGRPDLIVIDEAHHALAETYRELWKRYPEARKLGMTATPCRLNGKGFTDLFDALTTSWSIAEFIGKGWLSAFDYVSIRADSREQQIINSLKKRGVDGDYQVKEMNEVLNRQVSIRRLYESVERYAAGKKGMVYAVSIAHARQIAAYYNAHGVSAVAIDSKTPASERRELVEGFRQGRIRVLVNVDIFSEGFDCGFDCPDDCPDVCPDVEFVQLARPTLSLAKYLQQVGRGLRKSGDKESCMLIDNVGLHRIFGLPVRERDWEAMFEGRILGDTFSRKRAENGLSVACSLLEEGRREEEWEMVMTHGQLLDAIRNRNLSDQEEGRNALSVLKAFHDRCSGLWGLRRRNRVTVMPRYKEVFDTCADRAAVCLEDGRTGVVDDNGKPKIIIDRCRRLRFLKGELLAVTGNDGTDAYIDLKTDRTYREKPVVCSYGSVELLKVGETFHSRTRKAYASMRGLHKDSLCFYGFYLKITDYRVPKSCKLADPVWSTVFDVFACLLEGDDEEVYWCCGRLADRSIVVMDGAGRYYHVEKGKRKRYIAANLPEPGEQDFDTAVKKLKEEAGQRAEETDRQKRRNEEAKRRKRLEEIRDALPYRMGMKWGLKLGERIIVPPKYRKILPPVGVYCAFEESACRWGVMALDGKVMVEARYQEVDIENNGTVHLTVIPGKVKTVKL